MIKVTFPDWSVREFKKGSSSHDIALSISPSLAKASLAAKVNGILFDLNRPIESDCTLELIKFDSVEGKSVFWHSSAHVLASAILRVFPLAKIAVGPATESGFFYDVDYVSFSEDDLLKLENEMDSIFRENLPFQRIELSKKEALETFKDNKFKLEIIKDSIEDFSAYKHGSFIDLCRGPHLPSTGYIKAVKLLKTSAAYWKGDSNNQQLQRIYGVAFPDKKLLDDYLIMLEEAQKRDHRKLGKDLKLFDINEAGPGFIFFQPNGTLIYNTLIGFLRKQYLFRNYREIRTPIILDRSLWERSGHWDHYKDNMYFTKIDERDFAVKPMNCPGAVLAYSSSSHSYRDFPLRLAEFGLVHRHELSGALSGLFRVRMFVQDDAHIFVTEDQIKDEVASLLDFIDFVYKTFGFEYRIELSTRPDKAMGSLELWNIAETSLKDALASNGKKFVINPGDGAFYGPKIDFHIKDAIGRSWQLGTIQLDFQMPQRFDLEYESSEGKKVPVMLHRAILGSIERFLGILIEHYAGKFPLWLSPEQVRILAVSDKFNDYALSVFHKFKSAGLRVNFDDRTESIPYKVRIAQLEKVPYIIVVGEKEVESNSVSVRHENKMTSFASDEFLQRLLKECDIPVAIN